MLEPGEFGSGLIFILTGFAVMARFFLYFLYAIIAKVKHNTEPPMHFLLPAFLSIPVLCILGLISIMIDKIGIPLFIMYLYTVFPNKFDSLCRRLLKPKQITSTLSEAEL